MEVTELKVSLTQAVKEASLRVKRAFEEEAVNIDVWIDSSTCSMLIGKEKLVVYNYGSELFVAYYDGNMDWRFFKPIEEIEELFDNIVIEKLKH